MVKCLIARSLAEWVIRGTLARLIDPPKIQSGWVVKGTYHSLQDLETFHVEQQDSLPPAELPGLKFIEPHHKRRKPLQIVLSYE